MTVLDTLNCHFHFAPHASINGEPSQEIVGGQKYSKLTTTESLRNHTDTGLSEIIHGRYISRFCTSGHTYICA
jgi:hypothetical protein